MKKVFFASLALIMLTITCSFARIVSEDYDCNGTQDGGDGCKYARRVWITDDNTGDVFYFYQLCCDGRVIAIWLGSTQPIGILPQPATAYTWHDPIAEPDGSVVDIFSDALTGKPAGDITYTGTPSTGAIIHIYNLQ